MENKVSERYLTLRERVLRYSYRDMNLSLDNDEQVYIAVFDIPLKSNIIGFQTQTLALVFGLNTHIYHGSGNVMVDLEKNAEVSLNDIISNKQLKKEDIENKINIARNESSKESMVFQRVDGCCESINYIFELAHEL